MKKVFVTGCNGFIGTKLILSLLKNNIFVIGCDVSNDARLELRGKIVYLNFNQLINRDICFQKDEFVNIDVVYHLAWSGVSTSEKNNLDKQFLNFDITFKVLEFCRDFSVKKIIIPGSTSQFSKCKSEITGNEKPSPSDLYSATKCAIQVIASYFCEKNNLDLNWLLITSVYGSSRNDNNLISYTIENLCNDNVVKTTKLEQEWDYLYIDDLIIALYLIGDKGKRNEIYPIGSGVHNKLKFYVETIAKILNKSNLLDIGSLPYKNKFIDNSIVNVSKLNELGFHVSNDFADNIKYILQSK